MFVARSFQREFEWFVYGHAYVSYQIIDCRFDPNLNRNPWVFVHIQWDTNMAERLRPVVASIYRFYYYLKTKSKSMHTHRLNTTIENMNVEKYTRGVK